MFIAVICQDNSCSCMFDDCIHLSAVRIAIGLHVGKKRPQTNLSALRRRRRFGKKQGRKRRLDSTEQCAPDSKQAKHNVHDSLCRSESAETKAKVQALVGRGSLCSTVIHAHSRLHQQTADVLRLPMQSPLLWEVGFMA